MLICCSDYFDNPAGIAQGVIGASLALGSIAGSLIAGPLSDFFGRRDCLLYSCIFWLIGTAVQTATNGRGMLIGGRVLNGITVGITSSQVPVYLAEVAKHSQRGTIIIIQQLAIEWGILIMYFIGYGCSFIAGDDSFRTAWSIQFVPCVFFMIGLPFLPESPRWLAMKDKTEQAIHTLANIQAGGDLNDPYVIAQYEEIVTVLAAERAALKGWRKFVYNGMWRRTVAGFTVQAWQQLSGANVMTCKSPTLLGSSEPWGRMMLWRRKEDLDLSNRALAPAKIVTDRTRRLRRIHLFHGGPLW